MLGALAENMGLDDVLKLFRTSGALFPPEPLFSLRHLYHWQSRRLAHVGPKYETKAKLDKLKALLPSTGSQALVDLPKLIQESNGYLTHFDASQASAGASGHGQARHQGRRPVQGAGRHATDALSICWSHRGASC